MCGYSQIPVCIDDNGIIEGIFLFCYIRYEFLFVELIPYSLDGLDASGELPCLLTQGFYVFIDSPGVTEVLLLPYMFHKEFPGHDPAPVSRDDR